MQDSNIPQSLKLEGKITLLRSPTPEDLETITNIFNDPKTMSNLKYLARAPKGWTLEDMEKRHVEFNKMQQKQKGLDLVICNKKTGKIIGTCGLKDVNLTHGYANLGVILHYDFWGKDYTTEVHLLLLSYAFENLKLHRIEFTTFGENTRAIKYLTKLGAKLEGIKKECILENGKYKDTSVYTLFDSDWQNTKTFLINALSSS